MMTFALEPSGCHAPAPDTSLGHEGRILRQLIAESVAPAIGRDDDVFEILSAALERASRRGETVASADTFIRTVDLLRALPLDYSLPNVVVESETEIGLDWDEGNRRIVSLTVDETPMVGYSSLLGQESQYGRFEFVGECLPRIPETLRNLLERLYPVRR